MEQRGAIKFRVKLKKTATETFEMLKSAYGGECLSRTVVSEWHKRFREAQKARIQKSRVKTTLTEFVMLKASLITNSCRKNSL
jgi:hypothetical protein